ncbi:hypothetical protein [Streptomyces yatensis]|uniref:hypothetical protein n=1 Tax=Streptomyces yatensis TaxID=155177 RepID=UPI001B3C692B|nr:hypothetical protein [Streptomyces yatensis]
MPEERTDPMQRLHTENSLSDRSHVDGPVVQAGVIHGGVTIHHANEARELETPCMATGSSIRTTSDLYEWADEPADPDTSAGPWTPEDGARVLVEGLAIQAVVLRGMRPVVLSRKVPRPAKVWRVVFGILETRGFTTDLGADHPVLRPLDGPDFPFTVTSSDPELFKVYPAASAFEIEWHLELEWSSAGRHGTLTVDDGGRPFHFLPRPRLTEQ